MEQEEILVRIEDFNGDIMEIKSIPLEGVKKRPMYLDSNLVSKLREAINSSPIFWKDAKYHSIYNQVCAVMDRLETAVAYINKHCYYPKSEEKLICFMVFACLIVDAPKMLAKKINAFVSSQGISEEYKVKLPFKKDRELFKDICINAPFNLVEKDCPTDDEFFSFFRSITFAHPYETNKLFHNLGNQVSPWLNVNNKWGDLSGAKGTLGITIYSDLKDKNNSTTHTVKVPFKTIKRYIKIRYEAITVITQWVKNEIRRNEDIWKLHGIARGHTPVETLLNVKQSLKNRCQDTYEIDAFISYLTCELTDESNIFNVKKYREALLDKIDKIYLFAKELDYEGLLGQLEICYIRPQFMHQHAYYQLEKIFSYLNEGSNYSNILWARQQSHEFSKLFAKKWVTIDAKNMSFEEIKLLVTTACFLEYQEQEREQLAKI